MEIRQAVIHVSPSGKPELKSQMVPAARLDFPVANKSCELNIEAPFTHFPPFVVCAWLCHLTQNIALANILIGQPWKGHQSPFVTLFPAVALDKL